MVKQSVYMQLVTPRVVPMAVSTAMSICKIVFQTSFFISFLVVQQSVLPFPLGQVFFNGSTISYFLMTELL